MRFPIRIGDRVTIDRGLHGTEHHGVVVGMTLAQHGDDSSPIVLVAIDVPMVSGDNIIGIMCAHVECVTLDEA